MPVRQLTLYDFLADFVPGTFAVVLAAVGFQATRGSLLALPLDLGFGSGILVVVLCYLTGRTIHLLAGQYVMQALRGGFDLVLDWYGSWHPSARYRSITTEPKASAYVDADDGFDGPQQAVVDELPELLDQRFDAWEIDPDTPISTAEFEEFRRIAYSLLFDGSTLYQRYNIQETYYRNLWAVTTLAVLALSSAVFVKLLGVDTLPGLGPWIVAAVLTALGVGPWLAAGNSSNADDFPGTVAQFVLSALYLSFVTAAVLSLALGVVISPATDLSEAPGLLAVTLLGLLSLATLFEIRRRQFKRRQERALLNDLYLHLSETDARRHHLAGSTDDADPLAVTLRADGDARSGDDD